MLTSQIFHRETDLFFFCDIDTLDLAGAIGIANLRLDKYTWVWENNQD